MKYKDLVQQISNNSEFKKWYKEFWDFVPPKRKLRIFIDRNIPDEAVKELKAVKSFKCLGIAKSNEEDEVVFNKANKLKAVLITRDKDFWDDKRFPLRISAGILIVEGKTAEDVIDNLAWFFGVVGVFDAISKAPDWMKATKWKISMSGYVQKILNYKGKIEVEKIEY